MNNHLISQFFFMLNDKNELNYLHQSTTKNIEHLKDFLSLFSYINCIVDVQRNIMHD